MLELPGSFCAESVCAGRTTISTSSLSRISVHDTLRYWLSERVHLVCES